MWMAEPCVVKSISTVAMQCHHQSSKDSNLKRLLRWQEWDNDGAGSGEYRPMRRMDRGKMQAHQYLLLKIKVSNQYTNIDFEW